MIQDDMLTALKLFIDYDNSLYKGGGAPSLALYDRAILLARSVVAKHEAEHKETEKLTNE